MTETYGIGGLKAALEMAGYVGGAVRAPLQRPTEEAFGEIENLLSEVTATVNETGFAKVSEARP